MTHSVDIFVEASQAISQNTDMVPRSGNDKEYFPQDWFIDRLVRLGKPFTQQGRNSYPDFWVGDGSSLPVEGYEIKSLSFGTGRPARRDYDSNSTVPSGKKGEKDIFLVFFLYTGTGASNRPINSFVIAHTDLINSDSSIAGAHCNAGIPNFGSYADGHIRNRKMYRFPHPYSLLPSCIGKSRLITPSDWNLQDDRIVKVDEITRVVTDRQVRHYTVDLHNQASPRIGAVPYCNAGEEFKFTVWEKE